MKAVFRSIRRQAKNWKLRSSHVGLKLDQSVDVTGCDFGRHNMFCAGSVISNSTFGDYSYVSSGCRVSRATIGKFCSIGPLVIIAPGMHPTDHLSSHPLFYSTSFPCKTRLSDYQAFKEKDRVIIGHDVWIGARATILDGVTIGTGAIVAAHSLVREDVPPYTIVGGTPAREIKMRFSDEQVRQLLGSRWWDQSEEFLREQCEHFHSVNGLEKLLVATTK